MVETILLEQLAAFHEHGTLSAAAEALHMSQPSLSRSMQRLEDAFGVKLFDRNKNRLSLNENGLLAVECAKRVLDEQEMMLTRVRALDRSRRTIAVGACAPGPMFELSPLLSSMYPDMTTSVEFRPDGALVEALTMGMYQLVIVRSQPEGDDIAAHPCGSEHLYATLPIDHPLSEKKSLKFTELNGTDFLMVADVGFWGDIVRTGMPDSRFHLQRDNASLSAVVASSNMPSFATDLTLRLFDRERNRVAVPFDEPEAVAQYWCCCLKKEERRFEGWFQMLRRNITAGSLLTLLQQ